MTNHDPAFRAAVVVLVMTAPLAGVGAGADSGVLPDASPTATVDDSVYRSSHSPPSPRPDDRSERTTIRAQTESNASDPQTAGEFLAAFRSLQGRPAMETYNELAIVRSQASVEAQTGTLTPADRRRLSAVLQTLRSFAAAQQRAEDGSLDEAFARANATQSSIDRLPETEGGRYAALLGVALDRFYERLGARFRRAARAAESTPTRIEALSVAVTAFRRAGETRRFSRLSVRRDRLRADYRTDLTRLTAASEDAKTFVEACDASCRDPLAAVQSLGFGTFDRYLAARQTQARARTALSLAREHGLSDRSERLASMTDVTAEATQAAAIASSGLLFAYAAAVAVVGWLVSRRVQEWARDESIAGLRRATTPMEVRGL